MGIPGPISFVIENTSLAMWSDIPHNQARVKIDQLLLMSREADKCSASQFGL